MNQYNNKITPFPYIEPEQDAVRVVLAMEPVAASRPRVTRWGTFYAEPYKSFLAAAPEALYAMELPMLEGPLAVQLVVVCTKPKTSKLDLPRQDIDNFAKSVLDALTKAGAWIDDAQVARLVVEKRFALKGEAAHTTIEIRLLEEAR